jgi:hypothetical protein
MEKEFIPYEQALALKELGFNEPCWCYFMNGIFHPSLIINDYEYLNQMPQKHIEFVLAPLYQQAFKWFREKYKLYPEIGLHDREDEKTWRFTISILGYYELAYNQNVGKEPYHKTYEEAELACLKKLIEIVKEKK